MKKRVTRYGKNILATVYTEVEGHVSGKPLEIHIDSKLFNNSLLGLFEREPNDEDYKNAHKWADEVIALEKRNSQL